MENPLDNDLKTFHFLTEEHIVNGYNHMTFKKLKLCNLCHVIK